MLGKSRYVLGAVVALTIHVCCGVPEPPNQREVTRQEFGEQWPFTVERGTLSCESSAVVFSVDGRSYAMNGTARGRGYAAIDPIWRENPLKVAFEPVNRLSESLRREIFAAFVECEDASAKEAEKSTADVVQQIERERTLTAACKARVRSRYKLTSAEEQQVNEEGLAKSWPPLSPTRVNIGPMIDAGLQLCR